jgi:hypothetical protein
MNQCPKKRRIFDAPKKRRIFDLRSYVLHSPKFVVDFHPCPGMAMYFTNIMIHLIANLPILSTPSNGIIISKRINSL